MGREEAQDLFFMGQALAEAENAAAAGEVPVGAVLVRRSDGQVLAQAGNAPIALHDPTAHAEMRVIREAGLRLQNFRLNGCALYVTLEPCAMCAGAMSHARIERLVFGAFDEKGGAVAHGAKVFDLPRLWRPQWRGGVLEQESAALLQAFFRERRAKRPEPDADAGD